MAAIFMRNRYIGWYEQPSAFRLRPRPRDRGAVKARAPACSGLQKTRQQVLTGLRTQGCRRFQYTKLAGRERIQQDEREHAGVLLCRHGAHVAGRHVPAHVPPPSTRRAEDGDGYRGCVAGASGIGVIHGSKRARGREGASGRVECAKAASREQLDDSTLRRMIITWICGSIQPLRSVIGDAGLSTRNPTRSSTGSTLDRAGLVQRGKQWSLPIENMCDLRIRRQQQGLSFGCNAHVVHPLKSSPGLRLQVPR